MSNAPKCPKCESPYSYQDGSLWICPECSHEWNQDQRLKDEDTSVYDSNGNLLVSGDSVTVIKDLKVKGSSQSIKVGTKVKNIRLLDEPIDGHDIACKIDGFGAINIKSEYVKKQ